MESTIIGSLKSLNTLNDIQMELKDIELNIKEEIGKLKGKNNNEVF